ncbi:MAG: DUF3093 family protein [Candidatus Coatesbacteria bacterium]|nr:DUF3093 family protein [Candidatus Coatesbacteria bacterium]
MLPTPDPKGRDVGEKKTYKQPRSGGDVVIYRESAFSKATFLITVFVTLGLLVGVVLSLGELDTTRGLVLFGLFALLASAVLFFGVNLTQLTVTVTQRRVILAFGLFRKKLRRKHLRAAEPAVIQLSQARGLGRRRGRDGTYYWATDGGPGVRLEVRESDEKECEFYVFSCREPARLVNILDIEPRE